jgi:hypothetical protein
MATETQKSVPIVNLDASPIVENTTGEGGPGFLKEINGHVASTTGVTSGSIYRLVRIPTNAKVKRVLFTAASSGATGTVDIDVAFSDSTTDGTQQSLAGGIVQVSGPADNKLFGSAVSVTTALKNSDVTFSGTYTTDMQNQPLWQALINNVPAATQFTADPGGYFDIVLKSVATLASGGDFSIEVDYVE